jgi:hypothetical protein
MRHIRRNNFFQKKYIQNTMEQNICRVIFTGIFFLTTNLANDFFLSQKNEIEDMKKYLSLPTKLTLHSR